MKKEEYLKKISELEIKHKQEVRAIMAEYAKSNNEVEIGDSVSDGFETIIVDKFTISLTSERIPAFVYHGVLAKKDGSPRKNGARGGIWQYNVKEIKKKA